MTHRKYRYVLLPLLFLAACAVAFAQANSEVTGIVTDQTGAVVSGATVTLTEPATGVEHTTVSTGTGLYDIPGLNPATYNLKATAKGFEAFIQNNIVVNTSATVRADVKLTLGVESQTVIVEANALAVQADSNVVSTLINEQQITELATNGRNVVGLATLGLGVSNALPDLNMPTSVGSNFAISFNGLNQAHNVWMIDGGEQYDRGSGGKMSTMPSQDALSEFQVLGSNYPPDYGISSGGTVSMAIKSGSQKYHGELWEFDRNDAFDAHNYMDNNTGQRGKIEELRYNVFGANAGGPVFIPHVYNQGKKKTFFFYNEEWRRIIQGSAPTATNTIPVADYVTSAKDIDYKVPAFANQATRNLNQIFVPHLTGGNNFKLANGLTFAQAIANAGLTEGAPFPNNKIPAGLLDPNSIALLATGAIPAATTSGDQLVTSVPLPTMVREDLFRIDHNVNDKWQLMGHFIHDSVSQTYKPVMWSGDSYPTIGSAFSNPSYSSVVKLTGALKPDMLLEAGFYYDGNIINIEPTGIYQKPSGFGVQAYFPGSDTANRLPSVNLGSYGTAFDPWSEPWHNAAQDYAEIVALSITHDKHAMKFGGGYNRYVKNQQLFGNAQGYFNFADSTDSTTGLPNGYVSSTDPKFATTSFLSGDSYIDFLLGLSTNYSQMELQDIRHYVNQTISGFAEDNWHITSRMSVQYGFRYDMLPHAWERNNRISNFDPRLYQAALAPAIDPTNGAFLATSPGLQRMLGATFYTNGLALAGHANIPRGLVKNDYQTYQPRLGFSYDLFGSGKTVLRGGFGTFFERIQGNDIYNVAPNEPFTNVPSANNVGFTNPSATWAGTGGVASKPLFPQGLTTFNTYYPAPGVAQYSLGVQHELAPSLIWVSQYVGNLAWHQESGVQVNNYPLSTPLATRQAAATGGLSSAQGELARTYPGYAGINQQSNVATGSYNSFQTGVRQQNKHNLSFEVDYTYSHEIDSQTGSVDMQTAPNPWDLKYGKGSGSLDRRHMVNINYMYKLPVFTNASGVVHSVLGGWEIAGTAVAETGLPWAGANTPGSGYPDSIGLGGGYTNYPNFSGKVHLPKAKDSNGIYQWASPLGFSKPTPSWEGGPNLGFGNAGRDVVPGPGRLNFTTSLYKSFNFTEGTRIELRAESFNTFNHTQFSGFHNSVNSSNFGEVTGAQDPRVFEFGGKFVF